MVLPPAVTVIGPAPPAWPDEQFSVGASSPCASAAIVPLGSVSAAGAAACWLGVSEDDAGLLKPTPVGVLVPFGLKQPSNSKTGVVTSRPLASVMLSGPTNFVGPPAV